MSEETAAGLQQSVVATQGTVQDVIQAIVTGTVTGDVHIGNIVYTRSAVEVAQEMQRTGRQTIQANENSVIKNFRQIKN